jgi:hypothetical protein
MLTAKQIAANRLDSPEAPGSRTVEGKAASRFNALKQGAEHHAPYSPVDPKERFLLDANIELCLRRIRCVEAILWEHAADTYLAEHPESEGCNSAGFQRLEPCCQRLIVGQAPPPANPDARLQIPQPQPTSSASFRHFCKPPAWTPQGVLCAASASLRLRVEVRIKFAPAVGKLPSPTPTIQTHLHILSFVPRINPATQPPLPARIPRRWPARTPQSPLCAASASSRLRVEEPSLLEPNPTQNGIIDVEPNSPAGVSFRTRASRDT